jgi:glycosyltransferase involved in cell wall biosynthesis
LYASCDVLVSLHRSEGLGLHLMEMMALGKPVIATAWSGNMDYSTESNSCLVGRDLIPVVSDHPTYSAEYVTGQPMWAEPRIEEAVAAMRRLHEDSSFRAALGGQAAEDMRRRREQYAACAVWDQVRDMVLDRDSSLWTAHPGKIDLLAAM